MFALPKPIRNAASVEVDTRSSLAEKAASGRSMLLRVTDRRAGETHGAYRAKVKEA